MCRCGSALNILITVAKALKTFAFGFQDLTCAFLEEKKKKKAHGLRAIYFLPFFV